MNDENSPWQYKPDKDGNSDDKNEADEGEPAGGGLPKADNLKSISWEAPEFIDHPHGPGWYGILVMLTAGLAAVIYLVSKDIFATAIIAIVGIIVGIFAKQKPGRADYEVSDAGLTINAKLYRYSDFKSFTILHEGALYSVNLFPLKRFVPPVSAYFEPSKEEKIVQTLGNFLPYEGRKMDAVDRLARRLRL